MDLTSTTEPIEQLEEHLPKNTEGGNLVLFNMTILGYKLTLHKPLQAAHADRWKTDWKARATIAVVLFGVSFLVNVLLLFVSIEDLKQATSQIEPIFYQFILVGFGAQLVDGLLGMGYGVTSQIFLMSLGIPPAAIGSSIHTAEMFSSGASGFSHYKFGNVNKRLFRAMVIPGVIGAIAGALLLVYLGEKHAGWVRPALATYAMLLGIRILVSAFRKKKNAQKRPVKKAGLLAMAGGFLDSFGGGGWGPLVTSTLISSGRTPNYVIGTVSLTEFFVTFASAFTFFTTIGVSHWQVIAGLIVGGVVAAPISARLAGRLPVKWMLVGVGCMVIFWSLRILAKFIF
ncbi:MAG: sulfite exporter TauE/SafE family protein [Saprospiraceae bacterium]|nr:sulfite exporter TauE/SafE family protein [Saprospiraceae bacterium]